MTTEELIACAEKFLADSGAKECDKNAVLQYMRTGKDREAVESSCQKRTMDCRDLAARMKPFLAEITGMKKETESFQAAYRFFEYATRKLDFDLSGPYIKCMRVLTDCGLTFKEAMLFDIIKTDLTPAHTVPYYAVSDKTEVVFYCLKNDVPFYNALRETLFGLTEAEMMLSERTRFYYGAYLYGMVATEMRRDTPDMDFKLLFDKFQLFAALVGKRVTASLEWYYKNPLRKAMENYVAFLKRNGDCAELFKAYGDKYIPYSLQLFCLFKTDDYSQELKELIKRLFADEAYMDTILRPETFLRYGADGMFLLADAYFAGVTEGRKREIMRRLYTGPETAGYTGEGQGELISKYVSETRDRETLLNALFFSSSKKVVSSCAAVVSKNAAEWRADVIKTAAANPKLNKDNRLAIKSLLDKWADEEEADNGFADIEEAERYAAGEKLQSVKLLGSFDFTVPVYARDKKTRVSEQLLKVIVDKYFSMKEIYRNKKCDKLAAQLDGESFRAFVDKLYEVWRDADYDSKLKAAAVPYCFYTSNANLLKLKKQCVTLCDNGRHAVSAYIIGVMAMNGGKFALMVVDGIANKFPYPKSKQTAKDAMAAAAAKYKIPVDVLGDMIIPDFGFNEKGERAFVYGDETLTLRLQPDGEVAIFRGEKPLKALPADSNERMKAEKKEFSELKKDIKTLLKLQSVRLERALMMGRCWTFGDFKKVFVDNPMMRGLRSNLVWGEYAKDGTLLRAFRYGPDGTAVDADYEELEIEPAATVALVHACDLTEDVRGAWQTFMAENKMSPPFVQLGKACYAPDEYVKKNTIDLSACGLTAGHAMKAVNKYNMTRLPVEDAGCFEGWYIEDTESDYGFDLLMEGLFIGCDREEGSGLRIGFFHPSKTQMEYWTHEESGYLDPRTVPSRIVTSVLGTLAAASAAVQTLDAGPAVKMPFEPFINENETAFAEPAAVSNVPERGPAGPVSAVEGGTAAPQAATENPKPIAAAPAAGDVTYLECVEGTSSKFWKIEVAGDRFTVTYGRIGTAGSTSEKAFDSAAKARAEADKLIRSKRNKGYVER